MPSWAFQGVRLSVGLLLPLLRPGPQRLLLCNSNSVRLCRFYLLRSIQRGNLPGKILPL